MQHFGRLRIEGRFLRSRVARRIFASIVACTMLPISILALISLRQVTAQLTRDAEQRLAQDAKQVGMTVLEKLLLLDATLRVLDDALLSGPSAPEIAELPAFARELAQDRFLSLAVAHGATASSGDPALLAAFRDDLAQNRLHLEHGGALLRILQDGVSPRLVLAHLADSSVGARLVAAELDPQWLFATDGLRPHVSLSVVAEGDEPVFHSAPDGSAAAGGGAMTARLGTWPGPAASPERLTGSWGLFLRPVFRTPAWSFVLSEPEAAVLAPVRRFRVVFPLVALLALFGTGLASLVLIRRQLVPIETLREATQRMASWDFGGRVEIETGDEFEDLGRSFNQMASSIAQHVTVMETVNTVGTALSLEDDRHRLLETILRGAMTVTSAAAGALHFMSPAERLERTLLHGEGLSNEPELMGRLDALAADAAASGQMSEDEAAGTLSIPMRNHEAEVIGVLQLVPPPGVRSFSREARDLSESLASQTAVALTRDRLAGEFRGLFEGLIQLLVTAIDEKSPYTGAHCRRVPVLTEMIADAACAASEGPLKEFTLSPAERYELRIAALLHDCGKVTTPVHVQDKATKLETLFDRIDLVDVRFEVVKRDLELAHLRGAEIGDLTTSLQQLDDDRAFLRVCNRGGEFMDRAPRDRVRQIAARWCWRGPDGVARPILEDQEVENLIIERGTLNDAERGVIHQHVVTTIQMLQQLPYPRNLRNVPFIAGCHHERMDGCGYPNHLTREQMSLQARILGLADVFEALTAKDRPYKPGMRVRTVLEILGRMKDEGHIDPDLFDVFVREKVYLQYAVQWLDPEQIDEDLLDEAALALIENARDGARS